MKKLLIGLAILGALSGVVASEQVVSATGDKVENITLNLCDDKTFKKEHRDLWEAAGCKEKDDSDSTTDNYDDTIFPVVLVIIDIALGIVGIVAVAIIIYGGVNYTISLGDAAKVQKAKSSIIYGVVGLIVALLAFTLVNFVTQSIFG